MNPMSIAAVARVLPAPSANIATAISIARPVILATAATCANELVPCAHHFASSLCSRQRFQAGPRLPLTSSIATPTARTSAGSTPWPIPITAPSSASIIAGVRCIRRMSAGSVSAPASANYVQYQNASAADYGVNTDALGNLRGYAYGANIGWVAFENVGTPQVNLLTGQLSGSVWSANCGWISLSNNALSRPTRYLPARSIATPCPSPGN